MTEIIKEIFSNFSWPGFWFGAFITQNILYIKLYRKYQKLYKEIYYDRNY